MTAVEDRNRRAQAAEQLGEVFHRGVGTLEDSAVGSLKSFGALVALTLDTIVATFEAIRHRRFSWREFVEQGWFLVSVSLLPTLLIAIPFGLVIVLEVGGLATQIGATSFVGAVDAIGTVREAAPIITALLLAGAGGSAICSDLGARTIRDEIAALQVMGIDPIERLVAPRMLATVVVAVLLNGIVAMAGDHLSGYVADVYSAARRGRRLLQLLQRPSPSPPTSSSRS